MWRHFELIGVLDPIVCRRQFVKLLLFVIRRVVDVGACTVLMVSYTIASCCCRPSEHHSRNLPHTTVAVVGRSSRKFSGQR